MQCFSTTVTFPNVIVHFQKVVSAWISIARTEFLMKLMWRFPRNICRSGQHEQIQLVWQQRSYHFSGIKVASHNGIAFTSKLCCLVTATSRGKRCNYRTRQLCQAKRVQHYLHYLKGESVIRMGWETPNRIMVQKLNTIKQISVIRS